MNIYKFCFNGRQLGAMGVTWFNCDTFLADNLSHAIGLLYSSYEHISMGNVYENGKEIELDIYNKTQVMNGNWPNKYDLSLAFNQRISAAGIEITYNGKEVTLTFNGKSIQRPIVNSIERVCYEQFEVHI
jgi:hypothetical protein